MYPVLDGKVLVIYLNFT